MVGSTSVRTDIYPPARSVAPRVRDHFARHVEIGRQKGLKPLAAAPETQVVEAVIDAAFWASLRREEGYVPTISLAYLPPDDDPHPLLFEQPLPLTPGILAKLAPVVERPGIHLGVWQRNGALVIWGTTRSIPQYCFVVEVVEPGLIVLKHAREERSGKYVNVAVLEGDQCKVIDEGATGTPDCPLLLKSLLGVETPFAWAGSANILIQLAVAMRAHGRGGSLLVVPASHDQWRESLVRPIGYAVVPPFKELATLIAEAPDGTKPQLQSALRESIDAVAGLTAVDGATVMTDTFELLAFGAKITPRTGSTLVPEVTVTEPVEGDTPAVLTPPQLGGTRHLSAAQFVHDQRDAVALVASQDRRFTIFTWSPCAGGVHAHRVDTLLL
jgi:hypothetical protein